MKKPIIYATRQLPGLNEWAKLNGQYTLEVNKEERNLTYAELNDAAEKADALITVLSDNIDKDFLRKNQHLHAVANYAVGFNNIDVEEAKRLGVAIGNTPDVLTEATAETALILQLMLARRIPVAVNAVKSGDWTAWEPSKFNGFELSGKTLGIIGFGRIGQVFAQKMWSLYKCPIVVYPRESAKKIETDFPFRVVEKEEFFNLVDIVSLHCPKTPETENLINSEFIKSMKKPFFFINTSRGDCHNEEALLKGLIEKKLLGVGLDVTNPEPTSRKSPLLKEENCIVLPHIGSATSETRKKMTLMCLENITSAFRKVPLPFAVYDPFKI
ncbi:MAG: D-glycerate dehydrogenase [Bacteriovoracaceae bacterium]|nr:D-glycerate dehydrogenase [Bacteriovoracaceae bacterium]